MLPSFANLSISTKIRWSASEAKVFLDDVYDALTRIFAQMRPPRKPPLRDSEMYRHVAQYLTQTFTPHDDLSDHTKNAVLWSTAMFIENVLTDWGLSNGFWVGKTRFANNDVENLRDERERAMELFNRTRNNLMAMKASTKASLKKHVSRNPPVAFVYIVAQKLGFVRNSSQDTGPYLLLMGHTGSSHRRWGVPGGLRDHSDSSTLFSAMRELGEELFGMHPSAKDVGVLIQKANAVGTLSKLTQTPISDYTAWMLNVDSALQFEIAFGLPKRTVDQKYNAPLSKETRGYLWIPLPLEVYRKSSSDPWLVNAPDKLQRRPLILRWGVLGPSKLIPT